MRPIRLRGGWLLPALRQLGLRDGDSEQEALAKALLAQSSALIALLACVWVGTYLLLGLWWAAAIPFAYQVATVVGLVRWRRSGRADRFAFTQLLLMLALPFLLQWTLGGFVAASAVALWALASPMGAVMFGVRPWPWFLAFLGLMLLSGLLEPWLEPAAVPAWLRSAFFVLNLAVTSSTVFVLLDYFLRERDAARAALDEQHRALEVQRAESERLLLNILPTSVAERLKHTGEPIADAATATVLFADIVDFTTISARIAPAQVVRLLSAVFSELDRLADLHGLEKIKTIGDAYMAVGGLPEPRADHVAAVADMALAIVRAVETFVDDRGRPLRIRVGMDTGPVVAGVIGRRRFSYDLWGDTVNRASRMESHGEPGRVQVTGRVIERLSDCFIFEHRGTTMVKGMGAVPTWVPRAAAPPRGHRLRGAARPSPSRPLTDCAVLSCCGRSGSPTNCPRAPTGEILRQELLGSIEQGAE